MRAARRVERRGPPADVSVGGADLASDVLVATAALEITVHGWDVGCATTGDRPGSPRSWPTGCCRWPDGWSTGTTARSGSRRRSPRSEDAPADRRLLAFLGRT